MVDKAHFYPAGVYGACLMPQPVRMNLSAVESLRTSTSPGRSLVSVELYFHKPRVPAKGNGWIFSAASALERGGGPGLVPKRACIPWVSAVSWRCRQGMVERRMRFVETSKRRRRRAPSWNERFKVGGPALSQEGSDQTACCSVQRMPVCVGGGKCLMNLAYGCPLQLATSFLPVRTFRDQG